MQNLYFTFEGDIGGPIYRQRQNVPFSVRISATNAAGQRDTSFNGSVIVSSMGTLTQGGGSTAAFTNGVLASHTLKFSDTGSFVLRAQEAGGGAGASNAFEVVADRAPLITENPGPVAVTMDEDGSPVAFSLTLHASDADGDTLSWSISSGPSHGVASASGSGASKAIGYCPNANYSGSDSFTVQVSDGLGGVNTITINVTIKPRTAIIAARETQDTNGNGRIDAIRIVTDVALTDNFAGVNITVDGYTVLGYDTGSTANDNEFFVRLAEGPMPDANATPGVQIVAGGNLWLPVDAGPVTAMDRARPVLVSAMWGGGSGGGVAAGDGVYLTFSEPVTSNSALAADFGLPVTNDTFGAGASVSNGQNQQNPNLLILTLQGNPHLTPGGVYSPGALAAGSPTGVYVADGTRIVDAVGNAALVQTIGTAVDLGPGTETISICWSDWTIAPKNWPIGTSSIGRTHWAYAAFPPDGLAVRNNGNVREKFTVSSTGASQDGQPPYIWALASNAGRDQFEMKVYEGTNWLDLAAGPQDIVGQLYSGHNKAFDLQYRLPTSVTAGVGVELATVVTITAMKD